MKVIFLKDVPRVAKRGDIKEVNDGYALNFLFPKNWAERATPAKIQEFERRKKEIVIEKKIQEDLLIKNLKQIENIECYIKTKANEKGHLFSAIHKKDIIENLHQNHKIEIDEESLVLDKPIKELGEFKIKIKVLNKEGYFTLKVENL